MADDDDSSSSTPYKLVVVARSDLGMTAGKLASQVGHAVHDAVRGSKKEKLDAWEEDGSMIVVLQACGSAGLRAVSDAAKKGKLATFEEIDEGLTELDSGELTTVAVGPDETERVNAITGRLQLFSTPVEEELEQLRRRLQDAEAELQSYRSKEGGRGGSAANGDEALDTLPPLRVGEVWFVCNVEPLDDEAAPPPIPEMFEMWCWEGDKTVLPLKWADALSECCGGAFRACSGTAALEPWEATNFDDQGIFFLTHRSDTCGIAVALPAAAPSGVGGVVGFVAGWGVHPDFRRRGLGRCLLRLCLRRHAELGRRQVFCAVDTKSSPDGTRLLEAEGFKQYHGV